MKNRNNNPQSSTPSAKIDMMNQFFNAYKDQEEFGEIFSSSESEEFKKKVNDALNSTPDPSLSKTSYYTKPVQSSPYDHIEKNI